MGSGSGLGLRVKGSGFVPASQQMAAKGAEALAVERTQGVAVGASLLMETCRVSE